MNDRKPENSEHLVRCDICNGPMLSMFNADSRVAWAECRGKGHEFVQNLFTPIFDDGVERGYMLHGEIRLEAAK